MAEEKQGTERPSHQGHDFGAAAEARRKEIYEEYGRRKAAAAQPPPPDDDGEPDEQVVGGDVFEDPDRPEAAAFERFLERNPITRRELREMWHHQYDREVVTLQKAGRLDEAFEALRTRTLAAKKDDKTRAYIRERQADLMAARGAPLHHKTRPASGE